MKRTGLPASTADRAGGRYRVRGRHGGDDGGLADRTYAVDPASTDMAGPDSYEMVIKSRHLEDGYIDDMLKMRGLDAQQIREAKSKVRAYLDLLLKDKGVDMTDDAYGVLVNMAIHLIDESSKVE